MTQDIHKLRHDVRAAINTMQDVADMLADGLTPDPELLKLYVAALRKAGERLEALYEALPTLNRG